MEILHDDFLPESDGDNQAHSSRDSNFDEHTFGEEDAELVAENVSSVIPEAPNEINPPQDVTQSTNFPSRKVHSAAPASNVAGLGDILDDIPRPYIAAGADEFPSGSLAIRQRKKKSAAVREKSASDSKTSREERPRSADVNGWGDFDTDRLFRDDVEDQSNQTSRDPLDGQRSRSRKSRRSTPATPSPGTNPWEGYLTLNIESKESSRPHMQVLQQKSIEILNLDLVSHTNERASATPKPLLGRVSLDRLLSSRSRPITSHASRPATPTLLFGTEIPDTPKNRTTIFSRFADLWSLISPRLVASPVDQTSEPAPSAAVASPASANTRSPFECSMAMVKLCKTVGISLTPSAATGLSFSYTNEQGVDFESFCDLVIQGAIQPALHHFNLDNSIYEYVSALDTIVQSLVTMEPVRRRKEKTSPADQPRRLKELKEIQPVFKSWKAGITPRLVPFAEDPAPTPTKALVTTEKVRQTLEASASQHMLAHQLPSEEARVTHVENIRRKVQLHKSWKFSAEAKFVERGVSSPLAQVSRGSLTSSHEQRIPTSKAAELAEMFDRAHTVLPKSTRGDDVFRKDGDRPAEPCTTSETSDKVPEKEVEAANEEVLVCCSCSVRGAVLWCSSCFTVNCQKCWQEVHSCTVDMSTVIPEASSARKPLLGPTALAMKKKRSGSATLRPPVAMIYLPTKAMVPGTLARGKPIVRLSRNSSNQAASGVTKDEIPAVVVNAILPSLHKSRSTGTIFRHHERPYVGSTPTPATDSTADLAKSLMLPSTTLTADSGSTGSHTSMESTMRLHKHHPRPKLHLAPVSLDAELLLSTTLDR
ncbi:hypothetical protein PHYPSEUDO_007161 [Phytophthora pseudosyringae]|uniref:B box-type domain-containing protein n=1 Tax=Phytophthora pseudosyringae TaxID=221518 RepID=A0A8T1VJW0_9STRA|nr:hypothetical protein PHYPSEUDO_007161 [Phytophthora pseudosyringae]